MRTSYKQKEKEIVTQRKTVTLRIPIRNGEKLKKTRSKKVCAGRRTSKKVVQLMNKTRNKKFVRGVGC